MRLAKPVRAYVVCWEPIQDCGGCYIKRLKECL